MCIKLQHCYTLVVLYARPQTSYRGSMSHYTVLIIIMEIIVSDEGVYHTTIAAVRGCCIRRYYKELTRSSLEKNLNIN